MMYLWPSWPMDLWPPGAVQTAPQFKISSGMCRKFRRQKRLLRQSWPMDLSLPGAIQSVVVTARQSKISWWTCSRFSPQVVHLPRSWPMDLSLPGAFQSVVVTARQSKISWWTCSRFSPQVVHLPRSWPMDPSLPGVIQTRVVRMCNRFKPRIRHLLRSWPMGLWLPGAFQTGVATALQFKISSGMRSKFSPQKVHLPRSWPMDHWLHGVFQTLVVTAPQFKTSFTIYRYRWPNNTQQLGLNPSKWNQIQKNVCSLFFYTIWKSGMWRVEQSSGEGAPMKKSAVTIVSMRDSSWKELTQSCQRKWCGFSHLYTVFWDQSKCFVGFEVTPRHSNYPKNWWKYQSYGVKWFLPMALLGTPVFSVGLAHWFAGHVKANSVSGFKTSCRCGGGWGHLIYATTWDAVHPCFPIVPRDHVWLNPMIQHFVVKTLHHIDNCVGQIPSASPFLWSQKDKAAIFSALIPI